MKKRIPLLIAIIAISVFAMTACGGGQPEAVTATPPPAPQEAANSNENDTALTSDDPTPIEEEDEPQQPSEFAFKMGDFLIEMDQDIDYVLDNLGEPLGIFEAPSCAFEGIDRIFGYPGMQIHTYPKDDSDFVHTISLRDDSLRTTEGGIRLGSDIQAALDAYGNDYEFDTGLYRYRRGRTTLEFLTEDDIVMGITYGFIIHF